MEADGGGVCGGSGAADDDPAACNAAAAAAAVAGAAGGEEASGEHASLSVSSSSAAAAAKAAAPTRWDRKSVMHLGVISVSCVPQLVFDPSGTPRHASACCPTLALDPFHRSLGGTFGLQPSSIIACCLVFAQLAASPLPACRDHDSPAAIARLPPSLLARWFGVNLLFYGLDFAVGACDAAKGCDLYVNGVLTALADLPGYGKPTGIEPLHDIRMCAVCRC